MEFLPPTPRWLSTVQWLHPRLQLAPRRQVRHLLHPRPQLAPVLHPPPKVIIIAKPLATAPGTMPLPGPVPLTIPPPTATANAPGARVLVFLINKFD